MDAEEGRREESNPSAGGVGETHRHFAFAFHIFGPFVGICIVMWSFEFWRHDFAITEID